MQFNFKPKFPTFRSLVIVRLFCVIALFSFTYCGGAQDAAGQIDGGVDPGDFALPTDPGDFGSIDNGVSGQGSSGNLGGIGGDAGAFGDDFGNVLGGEQTVDQRNQGFVGATGTRIQDNGFVGPPGETSGPPLADGASFGGGTNDVGGSGGGGGGGRGGNFQNQNSGFGGTGEVKGFEVYRSNVRANLRPQFSSPRVSSYQVADRFQNRIRRIPTMSNDGVGVQLSISNGTATMQGFVGSPEESNRIQRQLRLEPGVYRINNQTQIMGR